MTLSSLTRLLLRLRGQAQHRRDHHQLPLLRQARSHLVADELCNAVVQKSGGFIYLSRSGERVSRQPLETVAGGR